MRKGLDLAVEQINAEGGIDGRKLKVVFYDPAGDTSKAVDQTRRLMTQDKVDVVIGGGSQSGIALAMDPIIAASKKLFMATEGAREIVQPADKHPTTFKATFNDTAIIQRTIEFWKQKGISKVAFFPDTSGFGQSALEVMKSEAPKAGIQFSSHPFDPAATDLTPLLTKASRANPQAYLAWTTTPAGVVFLKNAHALGLDKNAVLQQGFGFVDERYMEQAGTAAEGTVLTSPKLPGHDQLPDSDEQKQHIADFVEAYRKKYNQAPNVYAGQTYDAVNLVANAIRKTGGDLDAEKLKNALEGAGDVVGVTGIYHMTAQDHSGLAASSAAMIEWNGKRFVLAGGAAQ
jgi:branched-chain amino acid transport system substrate-binding protein